MRRAGPTVPLTVAFIVLLAACSSLGTQPEGSLALPHIESEVRLLAAFNGSLEGDEDLGCVWLVSERGRARIAAVWPAPHFALFDPLRIFGPEGELVWEEGTPLDAGGGHRRDIVRHVPVACRTGDSAWHIGSIGD